MIELKPNKYYRVIYTDRSEIDFQAIKSRSAGHLIEVRTTELGTCTLAHLLANKDWLDIFEIIDEESKLFTPQSHNT